MVNALTLPAAMAASVCVVMAAKSAVSMARSWASESATAWAELSAIPYEGVPVGTIKSFATGRGNAGKHEVIAAMRALGHPVTDDNEADALAILHWAIAQNDVGGAL